MGYAAIDGISLLPAETLYVISVTLADNSRGLRTTIQSVIT